MESKHLDIYRTWFEDYVKGFSFEDPEDRRHVELKVDHTNDVCRIINELARLEGLTENTRLLAETSALFHDIGRFSQYRDFKTFRDPISVNHGKLGAEILTAENVLHALGERERNAVVNAVRFHNAFAIPQTDSDLDVLLLKLVRDSDKLDIWKIYLSFFESGEKPITQAGLGLPNTPGYSEKVMDCVVGGRLMTTSDLRNLNDFTLMQVSWVYDLNFDSSVELLIRNKYLDRLFALLPASDDVERAKDAVFSKIVQGALK